MTQTLRLISSMATRSLLADLCQAWQSVRPDIVVDVESVGGVDAARAGCRPARPSTRWCWPPRPSTS